MLGLKRGTVMLCPHEAAWEREAERTIAQLKEILGTVALDAAHVGSTAIPTIMAKPIVDIALAVKALSDIDPYVGVLRAAGYHLRPSDAEGQRLLAKGSFYEGTGKEQTHFVHVVELDGEAWRNYLNFKRYLLRYPAVAKEYEALKISLCKTHTGEGAREKYLAGKAAFIAYTLRKATVDAYLGQCVHIGIDRPVGYVHQKEKYALTYPINYGFIPGVLGGDGEELDVYLLGVDTPVEEYDARVIAVVHRENDVEDKLVAAPEGMQFSAREIADGIRFQEQYYKTKIETETGELYTV